jgi:hypothetical protein
LIVRFDLGPHPRLVVGREFLKLGQCLRQTAENALRDSHPALQTLALGFDFGRQESLAHGFACNGCKLTHPREPLFTQTATPPALMQANSILLSYCVQLTAPSTATDSTVTTPIMMIAAYFGFMYSPV